MRPLPVPASSVLVALIALLVAGCGSSATSVTPAPDGSGGPLRLEVTLSDSLTMQPSAMTVPVGEPVTFVVRNTGAIEHEFYLGDETAQRAHQEEMAGMGGMRHDEPEGIGLKPGETKELTFTFAQPGAFLAGCHVAGHYLAGMKASITVR